MVSTKKAKKKPVKHAQLAPDDIRRIREKLGISQVEAGELLGGGPRAFTKYEGGTIKPAAAIANLLRMAPSASARMRCAGSTAGQAAPTTYRSTRPGPWGPSVKVIEPVEEETVSCVQ